MRHGVPSSTLTPTLRLGLDVEAIHGVHAGFVWACLARLGVREADRPDVLQEVFIVVHRRRFAYHESGRIRPWLYRICEKLVRNYGRKAHRRREHAVAEIPDPGTTACDPERAASLREARAEAEAILAGLDPRKRAVFVMFELEAMDCTAIAETLGIPVGTVYSRLSKARREVRRALEARHRGERGEP
jgi:RNA polymerase sigma-70 factor (ECF subfamily)